MGNIASVDELNNIECNICKESLPKNKYAFIDIQCSNCKKRCKGNYHHPCLQSYIDTKIKNEFICLDCNTDFNFL